MALQFLNSQNIATLYGELWGFWKSTADPNVGAMESAVQQTELSSEI